MERINTADGLFSDGTAAAGYLDGTVVIAKWLNDLQEEVSSFIEAMGIVLDGTKRDQLATAIAMLMQKQTPVYAIDTGAANSYVVNYTPSIAGLVDGMVVRFKAKTANTGASTLNVDGHGALPLLGGAHSALQGGEISANGKCQAVWKADMGSWVLLGCTGGALQVAAASQSGHALSLGAFVGSNQSLGTSGFQKLPGGMIRQWGIINSNTSGIGSVTFPAAFPNACVGVQLTDITSGSVATADIWGVGNLTSSGFSGYSKTDTGASVTTAAYYEAYGY